MNESFDEKQNHDSGLISIYTYNNGIFDMKLFSDLLVSLSMNIN